MPDTKIQELLDGLHPLEIKVLKVVQPGRTVEGVSLLKASGLESSQLDMAIGWLLAKGLLELAGEDTRRTISLTEAGLRYSRDKNPELRILESVRQTITSGTTPTIQSLRQSIGLEPEEFSSAVGALKASGDIRLASGGVIYPGRDGERPFCEALQALIERVYGAGSVQMGEEDSNWKLIEQYSRKRGKEKGIFALREEKLRSYRLTMEGDAILEKLRTLSPMEEISQLTPEMLKEGAWRDKGFRKYNLGLKPSRIPVGKKHAYRQFLDLVKVRLVAMGFEEMRGPLVETEFWNMDALYMPQFHPARDIHDMYFVKEPTHTKAAAQPYLDQVAETHKSGWKTASTGWRYPFDKQRAGRLILRSQGTAVSARTLAGQSSTGALKVPGKYFSIARCFRYEQVDVTHAVDFFQVEGIVLGLEINFKTLLGLLRLFALEFARAKEVKFYPAYFPFTEPSVELHVRHPQLGWMELGGAGLFRPEVTRPLGVEAPVIAWGLGLDRMAMMALGISDIRELFSTDLDRVRTLRFAD